MAHRAGTGDAPIPGLVTSRRNPAYKLKPRPKAQETGPQHVGRSGGGGGAAARDHRRRSPSPPIRRRPSPKRDLEEERRQRDHREAQDRARRDQEEKEQQEKKKAEEDEQKRRWAEQEAKWAEERRLRESNRKLEEQRQAARQQKLKGAFATDLDDEDGDEERRRQQDLAERQRRKSTTATSSAPTITPVSSGSSTALALPGQRPVIDDNADPVQLRAALADPTAARSFAPGEVAEHFRRLSEMKRRFRRAEFGGPDRKLREPSRSRSREKYNSVWIRPGEGNDERS